MTTFADFWAAYPRRVAKRAALKSWERELRAGTAADDIMGGLRRLLPSLMAREPQFIPHPATWLNQGRWEDETPVERFRPSATGNGLVDALMRSAAH